MIQGSLALGCAALYDACVCRNSFSADRGTACSRSNLSVPPV